MCDPRHVKRKSWVGLTGRTATLGRHTLSGVGVVVSLSWEACGNECASLFPKKGRVGGLSSLPPQGPPPAPEERFR